MPAGLKDADGDWTTIHFVNYRPDDLAVGGKLIAAGQSAEYYIDYIDMDIKDTQILYPEKEKMIVKITALITITILYLMQVFPGKYRPLALLIGGFVVARRTWTWVGNAWDEALTAAREKGFHA